MMTIDKACKVVTDAENLIESMGFKLCRGSSYNRDSIVLTVVKTRGSVTDAAREILKVGYINHEKVYGQCIYV